MSFFREITDIIKYFKAAKSASDITFYSEEGIYYQNFRATIETIIKKSDLKILYITSDTNDPVWQLPSDQFEAFYINKLLSFVFPFINTKTLILTMADLDNYHIKRSTNNVNHIYMFHAINSIHMTYNEGAFDHYDTFFCVGPHHEAEIRKTEEVYQLPQRQLLKIGYSWLEDIERDYQRNYSMLSLDKPRILIAPSWNSGNILETCIDIILERCLPLNWDIVVRPHPEFIKRQPDTIKRLNETYSNYDNFTLETESASSENIKGSSLLITDWSGIGIEYAWGMGKPVIYIDTPMKVHNPEYEKIGIVPLEVRVRSKIGKVLIPEQCNKIDTEVSQLLSVDTDNTKILAKLRDEYIYNWGRSAEVGADYIIEYCQSADTQQKDKVQQ